MNVVTFETSMLFTYVRGPYCKITDRVFSIDLWPKKRIRNFTVQTKKTKVSKMFVVSLW